MQLTQRPDRRFNRLRSRQRTMALAALLTLALMLAACGVTTSGGQPGGTTNGTATATAATAPSATPGGTSVPSVPPTDAVTLTTDQTSYTPSATINVTLINHRATSIFAFDHQTSCTILVLQRQTASGWQAVGGCALGRMTQRIEIKAGATMKIAVSPSAGQIHPSPWPAGTYRAVLSYAVQPSDMAASTMATSATFTVS